MKKCLPLLCSVLFLLPVVAQAQGAQEARLGYINLGAGWVPWNAIEIGGTAPGYALQSVLLYCQSGTTIAPCNPAGGVGGLNAALLPHWIACTARVKINAGNCNVVLPGDSTTMGICSNNTCSAAGELFAAAYPARLATYLNSALLPAQRDSFSGAGNGTNGAAENDSRVSIGAWTQSAFTVGGALFASAAAGAPLTFTPIDNVDTFVLKYASAVGFGVGSYTIDSGSPVTFDSNNSNGVNKLTIAAGSLGHHTIALNWVSGGNVRVIGVDSYNSAIGTVIVTNAGISAATSGTWNVTTSPWSPLPALATLAPDLIILDLGINDWSTAVPVATYTANMQALIAAWKVNSDIILVTPAPSAISTKPLATQKQYVAAMYALAAANNLPIVDNFTRWGSYELKNPAPYLFYGNTVHPNATGYSDAAQSIATQLLSVVGH